SAAIRFFDQAFFIFHCSCKSAFLVAKKLTFQQFREKALQLSARNDLSFLLLAVWMDWANTSLPVPVSPKSNTVVSVGATFFSKATASRMALDCPMILSKLYFFPTCLSRWSMRFCSFTFSIALFKSGITLLLSSPL